MAKFGIDISTWQAGYPYAESVNEGVEFAILRAGYSQSKDAEFENHYNAFKSLGIPVGAYWYLYAQTPEQARAEANAFISVLSGKQFEYPVYLDLEDSSIRGLGRDTLNQIVITFCDTVQAAGYYVGVYTNIDWFNNVISGDYLNQSYDWWIASWGTQEPTGLNYGLWQFGGSTNMLRSSRVAGVTTDQNYAYKDYPTIIKNLGLNGFGGGSTSTPTPVPTQNEESVNSSSEINVGDKVKVINPIQYNGQPFTLYYSTYDVIEVNGDRVVIGIGSTVTAAVHIGNLTKVSSTNSDVIGVGDKVKVINAIQYNGEPFAVYYDSYDVIEVSGDRIVIGIGSTVTAAVNVSNLIKL